MGDDHVASRKEVIDVSLMLSETDIAIKWWRNKGVHVSRIMPITGDPIGGAMCWMDTVVQIQITAR